MFKQIIINTLLSASYILLFQVSCAQNSEPPSEYFPDSRWRTSTPAEQGLDQAKIKAFIKELEDGELQRPISSFLIVKNGYLVVNEAFGDYSLRETHTLQSVTKSISSTLVGVAIQQGHIESLDQKVLDFFPEYGPKGIDNMNEDKRAMNLRHALTMRTGQAWTGERHLDGLNSFGGDQMKYVLDYEMETSPGRKWYYNSGIAVLLGGLLQNATGMDTREFAEDQLFDPLGITSAQWGYSHRGIPHTGGGLYLKPSDMARIGYLYLRDGKWEDQQIVPEWWTKEATTRHVPHAESISGVSSIGYGYMWWLMSLEKEDLTRNKADIFMAYGHWGQFIFIIPKYDMVVVFTNDRTASYPEEKQPIAHLYEYILPAIVE